MLLALFNRTLYLEGFSYQEMHFNDIVSIFAELYYLFNESSIRSQALVFIMNVVYNFFFFAIIINTVVTTLNYFLRTCSTECNC